VPSQKGSVAADSGGEMTRSDEELLALMEEGMREMEVSCQSKALQQNLGPPRGVSYSGQSTFTSNHCSAYPSPSTWTGRQDLANQIPDGSEYHSDHENVQQSLTGEDYPSGFPISTGLRKMSRSAPSKTVKTARSKITNRLCRTPKGASSTPLSYTTRFMPPKRADVREIVMIKGQECDRCKPPKRRERKGRRTCVVRSDAEGNTYSCTSCKKMKSPCSFRGKNLNYRADGTGSVIDQSSSLTAIRDHSRGFMARKRGTKANKAGSNTDYHDMLQTAAQSTAICENDSTVEAIPQPDPLNKGSTYTDCFAQYDATLDFNNLDVSELTGYGSPCGNTTEISASLLPLGQDC